MSQIEERGTGGSAPANPVTPRPATGLNPSGALATAASMAFSPPRNVAAPKSAAKPSAPPAAPNTLTAFAERVLAGIGAPVTPRNVQFIVSWANREGGGGAFNPLNTTQGMSGASTLSGNSAGVKNYTNLDQGVQATVKTLLNGHYSDLIGAFQSNTANPNVTYAGLKTWSGSGYSDLTGVAPTDGLVATKPATGGAGGSLPGKTAAQGQSINTYGYIAKLAKSEPDLANLMHKYLNEDLSDPNVQQRLEADIENTHWWTSHTNDYRKAEILKATDPATFNKNVQDAIPNVQQAAGEYLLPMSPATAATWANKLASGQVTDAQYMAYLKEQASSLFPGMTHAIQTGVTPKTYVQPYADIAAKTLEIPPDKVDWTDPKWSKALFQVDPKTGARTSMSLADWQNTLRTDPTYNYDKTQQAQQQAAQLATQLQNTFGKVG